MQRREFLKLVAATLFVEALPYAVSSELVIVDVDLADGWEKVLTFGKTTYNKETNQGEIVVWFNQAKVWKYVELTDSEGRVWTTPDQGESWHCGLMSFSVGEQNGES